MRYMRLEGGKAPRIPSTLYEQSASGTDSLDINGELISLNISYDPINILAIGHSSQLSDFDAHHLSLHDNPDSSFTGCSIVKESEVGTVGGYNYSYKSKMVRTLPDFIGDYNSLGGTAPTGNFWLYQTFPTSKYYWTRFDTYEELGTPLNTNYEFRVSFGRVEGTPTFSDVPTSGQSQYLFRGKAVGIHDTGVHRGFYVGYGYVAIDNTMQECFIIGRQDTNPQSSLTIPLTSDHIFSGNEVLVSISRVGTNAYASIHKTNGTKTTYTLLDNNAYFNSTFPIFLSSIDALCSQYSGSMYMGRPASFIGGSEGGPFFNLNYPTITAGGTWINSGPSINYIWPSGTFQIGPIDMSLIDASYSSKSYLLTGVEPLKFAKSNNTTPDVWQFLTDPTPPLRYYWFKQDLNEDEITYRLSSYQEIHVPKVGQSWELIIRNTS